MVNRHRKSWAGNLLMWFDLTLDPSFKVKRGKPNLKVLITRLLLVLEVWNGKPTYRKSWAGNLGVVGFDLGPCLQGQMRIAKLKSAYNSLIMILEVWGGKQTYRKSLSGTLLVCLDLTLDPSFKVKQG